MGKDSKVPEKYGEVVQRLEEVVKRLEGGEVSLEQSLQDFEEGIRLVRKGEALLNDAEKRIEQLLAEGGKERIEPLEVAKAEMAAPRRASGPAEDVPF